MRLHFIIIVYFIPKDSGFSSSIVMIVWSVLFFCCAIFHVQRLWCLLFLFCFVLTFSESSSLDSPGLQDTRGNSLSLLHGRTILSVSIQQEWCGMVRKASFPHEYTSHFPYYYLVSPACRATSLWP